MLPVPFSGACVWCAKLEHKFLVADSGISFLGGELRLFAISLIVMTHWPAFWRHLLVPVFGAIYRHKIECVQPGTIKSDTGKFDTPAGYQSTLFGKWSQKTVQCGISLPKTVFT